MARTGKLNPRLIQALKPGSKVGDGGNLWVTVKPDGSKYWSVRYTFRDKRREMGLGAVELVSLSDARDKAREARRKVRAGIDPIDERRRYRRDKIPTFHKAWERYVAAHEATWKNPKHRYQWSATLKKFADKHFGEKPVDLIEVGDVLKCLDPIWRTKTETASRLRGRIEKVLDWAKVRGYRDGDNPARWKGNLDSLLPERGKIQTVEHLKAVPFSKVGAFLVDLRKRKEITARALELLVLTASRPGMVRLAQWSEFDLDGGTWIVPADHMKGGKEFRVPLSDQAVALVRGLPVVDGSEYLFPNAKGGPLSDMAMTALLRRMEVRAVAHGFRSTFKDWSVETTAYPNMVSEMALAHTVEGKTEAAYRRGDLFEKRQKLMTEWADYCDVVQAEKPSATVTAIGAAR